MPSLCSIAGVVITALVLGVAAPVGAELRVSTLDVFLNDHEVTAHVVLLGAVPPEFHESLHSGVPTHVRMTIELWQFNRLRPDRRVSRLSLERVLTYNVVTKEYKVSSLKGETRTPYTTRELRDAQRVLSEARGTKLTAATALDASEIFYVRVFAETALNGDASWVARMSGTAEQTTRQSEYRNLLRVQ
jgi:hypothetical protein